MSPDTQRPAEVPQVVWDDDWMFQSDVELRARQARVEREAERAGSDPWRRAEAALFEDDCRSGF
jgi:hypothetical protein